MKTIIAGSYAFIVVSATAIFLTCVLGCGKASDTASASSYDTSTSETIGGALAEVGSSSDDSGGSNVASHQSHLRTLAELILPQAMATTCSADATAHATGVACSAGGSGNNDMIFNFGTNATNGCTNTGATASFWGDMTLAFNSAAACTAAHSGGINGMGANNSVTLTSAAGITRTIESGAYTETDSSSSGHFTAKSGGVTVTCGATNCSTARTVQILGLHRAAYDASGSKVLDHTLNTSSSFSVTGVGASRSFTSGTLVLQHNLALYEATSTISTALTWSGACCWPTGGVIDTTFSNGKTGTETLTFGACGTATVTNGTDTADVTFTHCN